MSSTRDPDRRRINHRVHRIATKTRRLGYRGVVLLLFGLVYICIGLAVLGESDYRPDLIHTRLPEWVRVAIWCVPGIVAVIAALDHKAQSWGFGLLFFPAAERCISFTLAWLPTDSSIVPGNFNGSRLTGALLYLLLMAIIVVIASWPDPAETQTKINKRVKEQDRGDLFRQDFKKYLDEDGNLREEDDDK